MKGMQVMENLLQRYPQIDVVLCSNDEMAMGAIEAIDAAGRMKATKVVGIDANPDSSKSIQEGRLFASIDGAIWIQSYLAVHAAVKYLDGKKIPKEIITENTVVTKDNASAFVIPYGERALPTWDDTMKWTGVKW
jgi:ABC-type sugar transport system substrate-binding protein